MAKKYEDDVLQEYPVPSFSKGYNSYSGSNTLVDDQEFPPGYGPSQNVILDANGAVQKVPGSTRFTTNELSTGHATFGLGKLYNTTYNKVVGVSNTAWYAVDTGTPVALTGVSFTADKPTDFCQAIDRLYGANNTDNLAYTADGATLTSVAANGNIGRWPISYNRRLYMTNATNPDRIYYSNPYGLDLTIAGSPTYSTTYFGTFDTDLTTTIAGGNKKNAGFIILLPGGGVTITGLKLVNTAGVDYVYVTTKAHGIWRVNYASTNTDGTIVHTIVQISDTVGSPSGRSLVKVANDIWFYDVDNIYTEGEVALYQNVRTSPKGARIATELSGIAAAYRGNVAAGYYQNKIYFAYTTGTYNDRLLIYDVILNAWSSPIVGKNASCFIDWEDSSGTHHLLAGSSNPADSRIYEYVSGLNDAGVAISANFTTKSFDCKKPGLVKRFGFVDVFYSLVYGVLTYEVFLDETSSLTGSLQLGSSASATNGIGSKLIGGFLVGGDLSASSSATVLRYGKVRIMCSYHPGYTISVKFSNAVLSEAFRVNALKIYYLSGDVYETI